MSKEFVLGFVITIIVASVVACKHHPEDLLLITDNGGNGGNVLPPDTIEFINTDPCDPDTVYFSNTIAPLLNSMCATEDCHDAVDPEDDVQFTDYAHILEEVEPGDPNDSDMFDAITDTDPDDHMPPAESPQLSKDQIEQIQVWIAQGARNNSCQPDCNPDDFSYSVNIQPIVGAYCAGCHGGSNPSGDLTLETHAQLQTIALDGRLMDALHATNNATLMPDNTTGLPACNIANFQNWVNAGAPNN